jgi:hypothetical protein
MSQPLKRSKKDIEVIRAAANAVDVAAKALRDASHLGPASNLPGIEAAERLVKGARSHTSQWRAMLELHEDA